MQCAKCNVCGDGVCAEKEEREEFTHNGVSEFVSVKAYECNNCFVSYTTPAQAKRNKRAIIAFKKKADGLLSGSEVKAIRCALGISQAEASKYFGGGPIAFTKYESDDVTQSEAMDKILRLADAVPAAFAFLKAHANGQQEVHALGRKLDAPLVMHELFSVIVETKNVQTAWKRNTTILAQEPDVLYMLGEYGKYIAGIMSRTEQKTGYISIDDLRDDCDADSLRTKKGVEFFRPTLKGTTLCH